MTRARQNSLICALSWLTMISVSQAAELRLYDNNKLVVLDVRGSLKGYYSGSSTSSYVAGTHRERVECTFLFKQNGRSDETVELKAWEPSLAIPAENRMTDGVFREGAGKVVLQFQEVPNGCRSKADGDAFLTRATDAATLGTPIEDQGLHAHRLGQQSAIGIRILPDGAAIKHELLRLTVPKWALVVLVKQELGRSFVRYIDPSNGRSVEGWITGTLKDPFAKSK